MVLSLAVNLSLMLGISVFFLAQHLSQLLPELLAFLIFLGLKLLDRLLRVIQTPRAIIKAAFNRRMIPLRNLALFL